MSKLSACLAAASLFVVSACSGASEETNSNTADDFAARINSGQQKAPQGQIEPTISEPRPGAATGPFVPGTQTDPNVACGANLMGPYIGKPADDATRLEIVGVIAGANEVRFIQSGSGYINPDPTNPRLNLMLDTTGIIRDARCG